MILENLVISFFATAITALAVFAVMRPRTSKREIKRGSWGNYTQVENSSSPTATKS
jgi:spermidine/putrescine-binding protein